MQSYLLLVLPILVSVILNTTAQGLLKLGVGRGSLNLLYVAGGICAYGFSTLFYVFVLNRLNLSIAYPVVIGLTIIATTFFGIWVLKEQVSLVHWIGIGLILSGISAITVGKL